jgi:hypothetical protein
LIIWVTIVEFRAKDMDKVASYWELVENILGTWGTVENLLGTHQEQQQNPIKPPPLPPMIKNLNTLGACCLTSLAARILFAYLYSLA